MESALMRYATQCGSQVMDTSDDYCMKQVENWIFSMWLRSGRKISEIVEGETQSNSSWMYSQKRSWRLVILNSLAGQFSYTVALTYHTMKLTNCWSLLVALRVVWVTFDSSDWTVWLGRRWRRVGSTHKSQLLCVLCCFRLALNE